MRRSADLRIGSFLTPPERNRSPVAARDSGEVHEISSDFLYGGALRAGTTRAPTYRSKLLFPIA